MKKAIASLFPEKGISQNAWIYSLGSYSSKVISLIIFPIIAVELGLANTGRYDLVLSTVTILGPVFSLQLGDAAYRWLSDPDEKQKRIGVTISSVLLVAMTTIVLILTLIAHLLAPQPLLWLGALMLISLMLFSTMMQILRGNGQIKTYTQATILRSILFAAGSLWAVYYTDTKLEYVLAAFALSNFIALGLCVWKGYKKTQFAIAELQMDHFKSILKYVYPLVFNALGWMLLINVNKYIISAYLGYEMTGIFAIAEKLATPIYFLGIFYFFSAQDHFLGMSSFKQKRHSFRQLILKVSVLMGIGLVFLVIAAYVLVPALFPALADGIAFLPWLALANFLIILSIYLGIPYTYEKQSLRLAITTILGILCVIALSFLLIKPLGLFGVCLAVLAGAMLILALRLKNAWSFFQV